MAVAVVEQVHSALHRSTAGLTTVTSTRLAVCYGQSSRSMETPSAGLTCSSSPVKSLSNPWADLSSVSAVADQTFGTLKTTSTGVAKTSGSETTVTATLDKISRTLLLLSKWVSFTSIHRDLMQTQTHSSVLKTFVKHSAEWP